MTNETMLETIRFAAQLIAKGMSEEAYNDIVVPRLPAITIKRLAAMQTHLEREIKNERTNKEKK